MRRTLFIIWWYEVVCLSICRATGWRPVRDISLLCDHAVHAGKGTSSPAAQKGFNELIKDNGCFPRLKSNGETLLRGETHRELHVWLVQCLFLAVILHPLCDCSIMCAMLLWMLWPPLSWKLLLIHDYPPNFLSGLHHLLQPCSLFISVANHHHHDKYGLMHVSWLNRPGTAELQSDGSESEVIRERGRFYVVLRHLCEMFQSYCQTL